MSEGTPLGLSPGSPNRIRRIEGAVLDYGSDMTPAENPLEMGMARLVSFDKSDFIGKSALEAIRDAGVKRVLHGVFIGGAVLERNNEHRWRVLDGDTQVGAVSSAVYSPRLERNIGFALFDIDRLDAAGALCVETPEGMRDIDITTMPFLDPDKSIPRASLRR